MIDLRPALAHWVNVRSPTLSFSLLRFVSSALRVPLLFVLRGEGGWEGVGEP